MKKKKLMVILGVIFTSDKYKMIFEVAKHKRFLRKLNFCSFVFRQIWVSSPLGESHSW